MNLFNNQEIEDNGIEFSSIYELFYNLKLDETVVKELKIDDLNYATIEFIIDDYKLKKEICDYLNWLVILVLILGLIIGLPITVFISYYNNCIDNYFYNNRTTRLPERHLLGNGIDRPMDSYNILLV